MSGDGVEEGAGSHGVVTALCTAEHAKAVENTRVKLALIELWIAAARASIKAGGPEAEEAKAAIRRVLVELGGASDDV